MTDAVSPTDRFGDIPVVKALFERNPVPMWLFDPQWLNFIAVNAAAVAQYGYSEAEFLRLTIADVLPAQDLERFLRSIEPGSERSGPPDRWRHICRDGRMIEVETRIQRLDYRGGSGVLAVVERARGDGGGAAGRASPAEPFRIDTVVESSAFVPFLVFDACVPNLPVVHANAAYSRLCGYARDELVGAGMFALPCDLPGHPGLGEMERAVSAQVACSVRLEGRRKDGSPTVHEVQLAPIRDALGTLTHYVRMHFDTGGTGGSLRPAEAMREARTAIRDREEAEIKSRTKTEFLARLSHELRTPLNAVIGFSELLAAQEDGGDAMRSQYLEHILDSGRHLLSLVDDVLDLQRVDERRIALAPRPLDLALFIATETTLLEPLLAEQNLTMHNEVPPGIVVFADERSLRQALLNLATNAIKYNRPSGIVRWTASVIRSGFAVLMVSDTGHGISREQIPRLFQPFDRLGKERSALEGTGLGLLIARGLIEHMGGRLDVESGLGVGTQVLVELPLAEPHSLFGDLDEGVAPGAVALPLPEPTVAEMSQSGTQSNLMPTLRLLYVEDNRINAMLFEAVLGTRPDIELRIADTGWEALDIVESWVPDVLVLDANLPDIHGIRLLRQLRELDSMKDVPAFMCSADAMEEDVRLAREAGFRDYWTKPIDFNKVLADLRGLARSDAGSKTG